jgi:hypothetical protein
LIGISNEKRLTWPHQRPEPLEIPQSLLLKKKKEKKENTKRQRSKHEKEKTKNEGKNNTIEKGRKQKK